MDLAIQSPGAPLLKQCVKLKKNVYLLYLKKKNMTVSERVLLVAMLIKFGMIIFFFFLLNYRLCIFAVRFNLSVTSLLLYLITLFLSIYCDISAVKSKLYLLVWRESLFFSNYFKFSNYLSLILVFDTSDKFQVTRFVLNIVKIFVPNSNPCRRARFHC